MSTQEQYFFFGQSRFTQLNSTPAQLNSNTAQLQSASEASAPSRPASRCQHHLPMKERLAVSFYYLVTMICRFKVLCLLSRQTRRGVVHTDGKMLPSLWPCSAGDPPQGSMCVIALITPLILGWPIRRGMKRTHALPN